MIERLAAILDERRKLEKQLADAERELALGGGAAADTASAIRDLGSVKLFARTLQDVAPKDLRGSSMTPSASLALAWSPFRRVGGRQGRPVVGVTDDLTQTYNAVELARAGAEALTAKAGEGAGPRPSRRA